MEGRLTPTPDDFAKLLDQDPMARLQLNNIMLARELRAARERVAALEAALERVPPCCTHDHPAQ